jgi:predicted RNase H-like nuclease (RuvC/YqgF family)
MVNCMILKKTVMLKKITPIFLLMILPLMVFSQEPANEESANPSLSDIYQEMYNKAETYNTYKVIKIATLNTFWKNVMDSLNNYKQEIAARNKEIVDLNTKIEELNVKIGDLESALQKSRNEANSISFLGLLISKSTYNVIVWGIIFGLLIFVFLGYGSHMRSQKLYQVTRKEFMKLVDEFESLKKSAHEKKIKLGRELQTERNKVIELEARLKENSDRFSPRRNNPA